MKSLSIKPINCRQCPSCYEARIGGIEWDIDLVINAMIKYDIERFKWKRINPDCHLEGHTIHGGEPLLLNRRDLKRLLRYSHFLFKKSGIQTNLIHMKREDIELFKKYETNVGISIDGHTVGMNKGRFPINTSKQARKKTLDIVLKNIKMLHKGGVRLSVIIILRECNKNIEMLDKFIELLGKHNFLSISLIPGTVYDENLKKEEIKCDDLFNIYKHIFDGNYHIKILPLTDIIDGLNGHIGNMVCSFRDCDPWTSTAELALTGTGELGSCLHAGGALDGLQMIKGDKVSTERQEALTQTPIDQGGCRDCKFWHMCGGGCPGQAIDNDYRNKTRFCNGFLQTYNYIYDKIKAIYPNVYLTPDFYPNPPDYKYIAQSISGSTHKEVMRIKHPKKDKMVWKDIILPGDIRHGDSNDPAWLALNPEWEKINNETDK